MIDLNTFIAVLKKKPLAIRTHSTYSTTFEIDIDTVVEIWHPSNKLVIQLPNNAVFNKITLTYDPCMNWIVYDEFKRTNHGVGSDEVIYNKSNKTHFKQIFNRTYDYLPEMELKELLTLYEIIILDLTVARYGTEDQI